MKKIILTINGTFEHKGKIAMERKITGQTMAKVIETIAKAEQIENELRKQKREPKKQMKIARSIN